MTPGTENFTTPAQMPATPAEPAIDAPERNPRWTHLLVLPAVLAVSAGLAFVVTNQFETHLARAQSPAPSGAAAAPTAAPQPVRPARDSRDSRASASTRPALPTAAVVPTRPAVPTAAVLPTVLQVDGHPQALAGDRVALPGGARFDLSVTPPQDGRLEVYAISPAGAGPALLWSATAMASITVRTPMMRLEGARGVERLRVLLRGDRGQVLGMRELRIWHV